MKRTPLYEIHMELGGKMTDFGGWELPVQYSGIISEHKNVRENAGIFDVSHMGEILIKGQDAEGFIQKIITNDISAAKELQAVYSPMCNDKGGTVDDLIIYKYDRSRYLLVVNASNTEKDYKWLISKAEGDVEIENVSEKFAQIALQGPRAQDILQKITNEKLEDIRYYHFKPKVEIMGINALVSRTGYTGEDGFEIYIESGYAAKIWTLIMEAGIGEGLLPAGLGARDSLRLEAGLPLYGHELSEEISPVEAGLSKFIKLHKEVFAGKNTLGNEFENGPARKLIGFEMIERGIPREHCEVIENGEAIGFVTSGSFSPASEKFYGMAIISTKYAEEGTEIGISIRNRTLKAKIVKKPFIQKGMMK